MDFLMGYQAFMRNELTPQQFADITKDYKPIYYRWVYAGPGNPTALAVAYEETGHDKKQFLWLYNRPGANLKMRQGLFDVCVHDREAGLVTHPNEPTLALPI
jgi:hypothetical protein